MKDQYFLHSKICNDNKKMYKFKKKNIKLKKYMYTTLIRKHLYMLDSKRENF